MHQVAYFGKSRRRKYFYLYLVLLCVSCTSLVILHMLKKTDRRGNPDLKIVTKSFRQYSRVRTQPNGTVTSLNRTVLRDATDEKLYRLHRNGELSSTNESAFNRIGYADVTIMKRKRTPREDIHLFMTPRVTCTDSSYDKSARWSMIVCVKSHLKNVERRNLIRTTWGAMKYSFAVRLAVIFAVGLDATVNNQLVALEQQRYGDLVQVNLTEEYKSVGMKVLAGMQWVEKNCQDHWIYASADDDIVPNLRNIYMEVQKEMEKGFVNIPIICHLFMHTHTPIRTKSHKNYVSREYYSMDKYPKFCAGGFYSMPVFKANAILHVSRYHTYFYNDDVWFTALLRLSAIDAGLLKSQMVSDEDSVISKTEGGSVKHNENGNIDKLREELVEMYPTPTSP